MKQEELANEAEMLQPRISAMERPGATKFNLETLIRVAAAFKVGLIVKFAPLSEMLKWENEFGQDTFNVVNIDEDLEFQKEDEAETQLAVAANQPTGLTLKIVQPQGEQAVPLGLPNEPIGIARIFSHSQPNLGQISHASH